MRVSLIFFSLVLSVISLVAIAGSDHGHSHEPVSQAHAEKTALHSIERLVNKGKLDKSWKSIKTQKIEKKVFGKNTEWVFIFNNKKISNVAKQTLTVFVTLEGEYIAANYTGK